jgi:hypothetical protein
MEVFLLTEENKITITRNPETLKKKWARRAIRINYSFWRHSKGSCRITKVESDWTCVTLLFTSHQLHNKYQHLNKYFLLFKQKAFFPLLYHLKKERKRKRELIQSQIKSIQIFTNSFFPSQIIYLMKYFILWTVGGHCKIF